MIFDEWLERNRIAPGDRIEGDRREFPFTQIDHVKTRAGFKAQYKITGTILVDNTARSTPLIALYGYERQRITFYYYYHHIKPQLDGYAWRWKLDGDETPFLELFGLNYSKTPWKTTRLCRELFDSNGHWECDFGDKNGGKLPGISVNMVSIEDVLSDDLMMQENYKMVDAALLEKQ